ncbi:hypothetical protein SpCBS45565_g02067 [Spizellomyces sp. 'palustris']|nr:hypothetical protein SpCBS45565_g02067 [Spizellomyces sp. 'palustris']
MLIVTLKTVDDLLEYLKGVTASTELLKATGIGVTVNSIRKNTSTTENQKTAAKLLVSKWKDDVASSNGTPKKATNGSRPAMKVDTSTNSNPSSRRSSEAGTPHSADRAERTIEGDNLSFRSTGDKVRDKCIGLLYSALTLDVDIDGEGVLPKAIKIEDVTYIENGGATGAYKSRIRSLCFNLKDKNNPDLRDRILQGKIAAERFANMTTEEMASADRKKEVEKALKESLEEAVSATDNQSETDMFQCGKCKQRKTKYYQMQTRSADEPMTTFVTCVVCGNKWKFC